MGKQNKQKGRYNLDPEGFTEIIKINKRESEHIFAEADLKKKYIHGRGKYLFKRLHFFLCCGIL